jgi:hypothetical protein
MGQICKRRTQEACLVVGMGREVFLGKRPEAVGCQGRREAHLGGPLVREEPKLEEPMQEHMSAVWRRRQYSGLYQRVPVQGFHVHP